MTEILQLTAGFQSTLRKFRIFLTVSVNVIRSDLVLLLMRSERERRVFAHLDSREPECALRACCDQQVSGVEFVQRRIIVLRRLTVALRGRIIIVVVVSVETLFDLSIAIRKVPWRLCRRRRPLPS